MAYRMTETQKWSDKWFRCLKPIEKLTFLYLCDNCDMSGVMELDEMNIAFHIGCPIEEIQGAIEGLARGKEAPSVIIRDGMILLPNHMKHQKNLPLNPKNKAHLSAARSIVNHLTVFPELAVFIEHLKDSEGAYKGLTSPTGIGIGKGRGNSSELEKIEIPLLLKAHGEAFTSAWNDFKAHRADMGHPLTFRAAQMALDELLKMHDPVGAIRHSIVSGYRGIFEPKAGTKPAQSAESRMYEARR